MIQKIDFEYSEMLKKRLSELELPIEPRELAEVVLKTPKNFDPVLVWICSNYSVALNCFDLSKMLLEITKDGKYSATFNKPAS